MRAVKFVPRKNWVVSGSDDMQVLTVLYSFGIHVNNNCVLGQSIQLQYTGSCDSI